MWLIDIETFSPEPINSGTAKYAEQAELLLVAWGRIDGKVQVWDVTTEPIPRELAVVLKGDEILIAHNAFFERTLLAKTLPEFPIDPKRWRCSMATAYAHGLPGGLGVLCDVLKVATDKAKQKVGDKLIGLFCKMPAKNQKQVRSTRETHPLLWEEFIDYCKYDVISTGEVWKKLPKWNVNDFELRVWQLDQDINSRGVLIDRPFIDGAIAATDKEQKRLAERSSALTQGDVESATQRDKLLAYLLNEHGVDLPDMKASTLERRIDDPDLPEPLKELLRVRLMATTSSTAKYKKVLKCASFDNRVRGTLQYAGASRTRRWGGRLIQPQNFVRPVLTEDNIEFGIESFKAGTADLFYDNVMEVLSSSLRGMFIAPKGKKLVVCDWSNIEGRGLAYLGGEEWKLQAFRDFDAGAGPDLYKLAYAKAFGIDPKDVDKHQRQIGKVMELAMGYGGGVGAFITFALAYNVDLNAMADLAWPAIPLEIQREAVDFYEWWTVKMKKGDYGLTRKTFACCEALKRMWRAAHPATVTYWKDLERAWDSAARNPKKPFRTQRHIVQRDGAWLRVKLPSSNYLVYPHPELGDGERTFMGINQYSRKWSKIRTYSGKLVENATQSFARDILAHGMVAAETAGYRIVLTVHDELICEAPDEPQFNAEHLGRILAAPPAWAPDIPLAAEGFEAYRYRKG